MKKLGEYGSLLRKLRREKGKTQREVAHHLSISATYASDVENGRRNPYAGERRAKLAEFLGVDPRMLDLAHGKDKGVVELAYAPEGKKAELAEELFRCWDLLSTEELDSLIEAVRAVA